MDSLSHFFLTAPGWVWPAFIIYGAIAMAWAFSQTERFDAPSLHMDFQGHLSLMFFGVMLVAGIFWPVALLIKVSRHLKRPPNTYIDDADHG